MVKEKINKAFYKLIYKDWFFTMTLHFMQFILGKERFDYWVWEMTPLPMGRPFLSQYWDGIKWAIKHPFKRKLL